LWARNGGTDPKLWYAKIANQAVRVPDPFLTVRNGWVMRRLAPDCGRIEISDLPKERDELRLLRAMGWETANVHWGSTEAVSKVKRDLMRQDKGWLRKAARRMEETTISDWKQWKKWWTRSDSRGAGGFRP